MNPIRGTMGSYSEARTRRRAGHGPSARGLLAALGGLVTEALDETAHAGEVLVLGRSLDDVDDRAHGRQIDAGHALRQLLTDPGTDQLLEVVGGCGAA